MKVANKVFVLTGAGGGIGGELAKALLQRGARVAAVDLATASLTGLDKYAGKDQLSTHPLNITEITAVERLPAIVKKSHGQIDGLINCAGIIQPFVKINDLRYSDIDNIMQVNFYGTLYMTKAFLPHLLKRPEAYIANVSSMGGFLPVPGQSIYGASKAAVKLMTEGLYAELLDTNVHVSVIFPGATKTNIAENSGVRTPVANNADIDKMTVSMLPAAEAAEIIIDGIEHNKPQIYTGKDSNFMNRLYRLSPGRATRLIQKQMRSLLK